MSDCLIPVQVKRECCRMKLEGKSNSEIYESYFLPATGSTATLGGFRSMLSRWMKKVFPDDTTLTCGTYERFTAHDATVQVSKTGKIVQAWIKQKANEFDPEEFLEALRVEVEPYAYEPKYDESANRMLEISLFDMHWGISSFEYYKPFLDDILEIIHSRHWDQVVIPVGQDFFHNDSIVNAVTTKGTPIEKVDMTRAVKEGRRFVTAIIDAALNNANNVRVFYSPGNHDRSISWMFMQVLLERYGPEIVDDSMAYRKVISYGKNSVMVTHGDSKRATAKNLTSIFAVSFPEEFAQATTREVHAGHLHHEGEGDNFGVMTRRLSSGTEVDDWSDRQDFVGAHRRFMIFEWDLYSLRSIHYICIREEEIQNGK